MVPRITSKGRSFKGAGAYFLHDLGQAKTSERVAFTHTVNMLTDDPEKAIKVMAWTAAHAQDLKELSGQKMTGRKAENPVYNYVLSWAPDQNPDQAHMVAFGERSLKALGLAEHEALFVAHNDTDHKHLHVIVNRVHPVTGLMAKMDHDQNRLSRLAQDYEEETGRVYCHERVTNNRRRASGERHVKDERSARLIETPEYQARRAARLQAQRQVATWHLQKAQEQDNRATAARDLKAAFDQAGARDDRQYRAKEVARPEGEERDQAARAWADERSQERARTRTERDAKAQELKEQSRRAWLDRKRAAEWDAYEAAQWSALNDKQMERREGLRERQAQERAAAEQRLGRKYDPQAKLLKQRAARLRQQLARKGARGLLDRLTGTRAQRVDQLEVMVAALAKLEQQKAQEQAQQATKHQVQRDVQAARHEAERVRKAESLKATKERRDARFEERERARAERLKYAADTPATKDAGLVRAWQAANRQHIATKEAERARRSAASGPSTEMGARALGRIKQSEKLQALAEKAQRQQEVEEKRPAPGQDRGPERQ